jgi:hypothetical protein
MKLRDAVQFLTNLPDGAVESDDGDFIIYPGCPVAAAIWEVLRGVGCEGPPIESVGEKGWDFSFHYRRRWFWFRVSAGEPYTVYFDDPNVWPKISGRRHRLYPELLRRIGEALMHDDRFHDVRWYAADEIGKGRVGSFQQVD